MDRKAYKLSDPDAYSLFGLTPTVSGSNVSGNNAINVPAVLQAVRLISENIGSLPCKFYHDDELGKTAAKDHPAFKIVHNRANGWTSAGQLRTDLTKDALIYGGGFAKVIRYPDGRPYELIRLKPGTVSVLEDSLADLPPVYRITEASGTVDYPHTEILHIKPFGDRSPVSYGREAIGLASVLEEQGAKFFASGMKPSCIVSHDKSLNNERGAKTIENIRKSVANWIGGRSSVLVLETGQKAEFPAMTSTDAQYLENRIFQIDEIARIFGVPPHMLFQLAEGTYANNEQMAATFLQLCLKPWLDRWQDAFATVLLTEDEQEAYTFEFVIDDLQRADAAARAEIFNKLIAARVITPNQVRATMNLPAMEGGDELANPYTTTSPKADSAKDET